MPVGQAVPGGGITVAVHEEDPNGAALVDPVTGHTSRQLLLGSCRACQVASVAVTPDGRTALGGIDQLHPDFRATNFSSTDKGFVAVWDTADGHLQRLVPAPFAVNALAVAGDGRRVILNGRSGWGVLDLPSSRLLFTHEGLPPFDWVDGLPMASVSRDGSKAAISRGNVVSIIDMLKGNEALHGDLHDQVSSFAWLRGGQVLAAGSVGGRLYFLSPTTLREVEPTRLIAGGYVMALEASPDGRVMASLGTDGDLTLWDTGTLHPYGKPVSDNQMWGILSFSADSRTLRVFHETGWLVELDTDPRAWVREACAAANRDLTPEESALIRPGKPLRSTCGGMH